MTEIIDALLSKGTFLSAIFIVALIALIWRDFITRGGRVRERGNRGKVVRGSGSLSQG